MGPDLFYVEQGFHEDLIWGQWGIRYWSTYDGDGIIAARVRDVHTDGSCVSAVYEDGGEEYVQAVLCRGWVNHLFYDQTGDSTASIRINRTRYLDHEHWYDIYGY